MERPQTVLDKLFSGSCFEVHLTVDLKAVYNCPFLHTLTISFTNFFTSDYLR